MEPAPLGPGHAPRSSSCSRAGTSPGASPTAGDEAARRRREVEPAWAFPDPAGALWKFPALRPPADPGLAAEPERPVAARPAGDRLRLRRASAAEREPRRPPHGPPLRRRRLRGGPRPPARAAGRAPGRDAGRAEPRRPPTVPPRTARPPWPPAGAIHRALEEWDLGADPRRELERQRDLLPAYLAALVEGNERDRALPLAAALLETFAAGPLLARLRALKDHVLARELAVLLPPGEGEHAPVGAVTGAIDLLYRDPEDGRIVIADYKTDEVATPEEIRARAAVYAPQGRSTRGRCARRWRWTERRGSSSGSCGRALGWGLESHCQP